jgi:hypothetical protein
MSRFLKDILNNPPGKPEPEEFPSPTAPVIEPETDLTANPQVGNSATLAGNPAQLAVNPAQLAVKQNVASLPPNRFAVKSAIPNPSKPANQGAAIQAKQYPSWSDKARWDHRISPELYDVLIDLAAMLGVKLKELNEMALVDLVRKYVGEVDCEEFDGKSASRQLGAAASRQGSPLIIKELNKLELLNYYSWITGNQKRVTKRDRKLFDDAYNNFDPLLFELGLRVARHDGRDIYSFTFCVNAMAFRAEWPADAIVEELIRLREIDAT